MRMKMPKVNKTKFAILGVLSYKPASGYDIKKFCDNSLSYFWNENYGHIYPVLKNLEQEGLISRETEYNEGKPPKNIYTLTKSGQSALNKWLSDTVEFQWGRNEFLLQLVFSKDMAPEEMIKNFLILKKSLQKKLDLLLEIERNQIKEKKEHPERVGRLWYFALRNGIHTLTAKIQWCDECILAIQEGPAK